MNEDKHDWVNGMDFVVTDLEAHSIAARFFVYCKQCGARVGAWSEVSDFDTECEAQR